MNPIRWVGVCCSILLLAGSARAQHEATEAILAGLREQPLNPVLLRDVKAAIPGTADPAVRCRLGVLYALGSMASGNAAEGLATRAQLAKAFPGHELLQELADDRISVPCRSCEGGVVKEPCPDCAGTGRCRTCKGTGFQTLTGLGDPRKVKCMYCTAKTGACKTCQGLGGFSKACPVCAGTGLILSAQRADILYRRLLLAMAPPPEPKGPVVMVVTAAPPAEVAPDPETVKREWVEKAVAAANRQSADTAFLQKYAIRAEEIRAIRNPELTAAQKEAALTTLRDKGLKHPTRGRYFFVPFPAGLRYCVADVKPNRYGGVFLKLTSTAPARNPPAEPLTPREALAEAAKAICEPLGDFLSDPTVCVSDADVGTAKLRKGEVVTSGDWLVPVALDAWGGITREGACYRTPDELLNLMGFGR